MVRVPFHTSQHATAGATPWKQCIPPIIPNGGIKQQSFQPTGLMRAPANQTGHQGTQQPIVLQDVSNQMNNSLVRQPSNTQRETSMGNLVRTESCRKQGNDQNSRGPVYLRDLESSWAKPSGKSSRELDGVKRQGSQETYNSRKRHWSNLRKNQIQNITETINTCIPTKKVKNDHLNDQTIDLTHEISTENDNLNQNTSDSEIPNEESNIPVSNIVKPLIEFISETVAVEDNPVKGPENNMKKIVFSHSSTETQLSRSSDKHGAETSRGITIATCNIEGVKTNAPFLQFLCDTFDIVFLQEHWLWEFQKHELSFLTKNKDNFTRCSDASDPLSGLVVLEEKVAYLYCGLSNGEAE